MSSKDNEEGPHPIQIITYNKLSKKFELQLNVLENILLTEDVRDANIAVVSIAGAFRKGKSFLLGFFLRYLNNTYEKNETNWLGDENEELDGFAWRGGHTRHTIGIWIWSKIFTKLLPSGEKIGVMLIDTQGTFDSSSTMRDNVTIFSLSTMLSSIQIYNLFNNIQEDNLQHLQLFTEYGKLAIEQNHEKAFQMLLFLIRDWSFPYEAAYGFEGGRQVLNNILTISDEQEDELKYVRTHIKSCYEKLDCFLMPHPGRIATVSQFFNGRLRDIDPEFVAMLKEFVPAILSPETVLVKRINHVKVNGQNVLTYIETYWKIFESGGLPTAQTILNATAKANNMSAKEEALEYYIRQMETNTSPNQPYLEFNEMVEIQKKILNESLHKFRSKAVFGPEPMRETYFKKLNDDLHAQFLHYLGQNESKKVKPLEEIINNLTLQITQFSATTQEQSFQIQRLQQQMEEYRQQSENEKNQLQNEFYRILPEGVNRRRHSTRPNRLQGARVTNRPSRVAEFPNRRARPVTETTDEGPNRRERPSRAGVNVGLNIRVRHETAVVAEGPNRRARPVIEPVADVSNRRSRQ